jgi:hypothetical protein
MITAFMAGNELHAAYVIRREGMTKIRAVGFCAVEDDAGPGIYQVPDWVFDGRPTYGEISVCAKCAGTLRAMKEPR